MKYKATFIYDNKIKVISSILECDDLYNLKENERFLSEEAYNEIKSHPKAKYEILVDDDIINQISYIRDISNSQTLHINVARVSNENGKIWIQELVSIDSQNIDDKTYFPIEKDAYYYLASNSGTDLYLYYIDDTENIITLKNLKKEENNEKLPLQIEKEFYTTKAQELLNSLLTFDFYTLFVQCLMFNNKLSGAGYFITPDNKDEIYNKIIESRDNNLISTISTFLSSYEKVGKYIKIMELYEKFKNDIKECVDEVGVQKIWNSFASEFTNIRTQSPFLPTNN